MWFFAEHPLMTLVAILIFLMVLGKSMRRRRIEYYPAARVCRACSSSHPAHAVYCRRCGAKL